MKASNAPIIAGVTCVAIFALCWFAITPFTAPGRAIAGGVVLSVCAVVFIWLAQTNRIAIARAVISVGATALAAPLAAMEAMVNESIFAFFEDQGPTTEQILEWDRLFEVNLIVTGFGGVVFVVSLLVGLLMHRAPKS